MSERVETTYADLRPTDLVIDKAGNAWPIADVEPSLDDTNILFYLCDPVTKVRMHHLSKPQADPVTVSRVPSHADEAAKLEAEFPTIGFKCDKCGEPDIIHHYDCLAPDNFATMEEAVAAVEEIGGTVEAEVTAVEVDAASAATEDAPVQLPPFADMTPLERRSHLYLLHGIYATDVRSNDELAVMHDEAHRRHDDGSLKSAHIPHVHEVA